MYATWLWDEREGTATAQENFDFSYAMFEPDDVFWTTKVGDPGPDNLLSGPYPPPRGRRRRP